MYTTACSRYGRFHARYGCIWGKVYTTCTIRMFNDTAGLPWTILICTREHDFSNKTVCCLCTLMFYITVYIMVETIYRMFMYIMDMCKVEPGLSMNQTDVHPDVHVYIPPRMGVLWWVCERGEHAKNRTSRAMGGNRKAYTVGRESPYQ